MNAYIFEITCGGPATIHAGDLGKNWTHRMVHIDPDICREYLERKYKKTNDNTKTCSDQSK